MTARAVTRRLLPLAVAAAGAAAGAGFALSVGVGAPEVVARPVDPAETGSLTHSVPSGDRSQVSSVPTRVPHTGTSAERARRPDPGASATTGLRPSTLRIPALSTQVSVVGIDDPGGTLTPPSRLDRVGWWKEGVGVGAHQGRVLLTGHAVSVGSSPLDKAATLRTGDRVEVTAGNGRTFNYQVQTVATLSKDEVAARAHRLFRQDGPPRLVLVTCEDYEDGEWTSNTIVIASPTHTTGTGD